MMDFLIYGAITLFVLIIAYMLSLWFFTNNDSPDDIARKYNTSYGEIFIDSITDMNRFDNKHDIGCSKEYHIQWNVNHIPSDDEFLKTTLDSLVDGINSAFSSSAFHRFMNGDSGVKHHLERFIIRSKEIDHIENMKMVKGNRLTYGQCDDRIILNFGKALYVVIYITNERK